MAENTNESVFAKEFAMRLSKLREQKGISARDMSLSLGQNAGYINGIENCKSLPSMSAFFYICEYLGVTPGEFFDYCNNNPAKMNSVIQYLLNLDESKFEHVYAIIEDLQ
ncbi:helix-turn-helix domain-containing protein [Butyrivibrio sp. INlla21]|uniref:helix-turn-helix domain-containing protein n=1 Tax=Butyrivibrio sp. INlla21 TaxID=1520811 RepID=UPI0008DF4087|nr:helix-turn-helix transcriptional regulator [Butyrivibrio sp. INlla21]SFU33986.1 Transcriptional regulator, contains XRE-family HTH domain [Butyrivibrio sp. INlla21]